MTVVTSFCERMRERALPVWEAQLRHPFVTGLGDGSLPRESFEFYIRQDARFLDELTKMFGYAVTRTADHAEMRRFGELLLNTLTVEQALHQEYAAKFGITVEEMMATPMAPTNYAYTRHLLHIGATDTLAAVLISMLPCAWIYAEVGKHFSNQFGGTPPAEHPYRDWLATYADDAFEEIGAWMRSRIDAAVEGMPERELARLDEIFLISSRYELLFWDMGWRREGWLT